MNTIKYPIYLELPTLLSKKLGASFIAITLTACNSSPQSDSIADARTETSDFDTMVMDWGDPATKTIRPGNNITTEGASCTTSFLFVDESGQYYVSTAAHCVAEDSNPDGCISATRPVGSTVSQMTLADGSGTVDLPLAYSSWIAMQETDEQSDAICSANDFALLRIPAEHLDKAHPASLHFRAPTGIAELQDGLLTSGESIWGFGASILKLGIQELHPKQGFILQTSNEDWSYTVYLGTPGIPGDSGGHIMTDDGRALGIASTLILAPTAGANNYSNIAKLVEYAENYLDTKLEIVTWDDFNPSLLP